MAENFLPYVQFKFGSFYAYDQQPEFARAPALIATELQDYPIASIQPGAERGVPRDCLMLAMRYVRHIPPSASAHRGNTARLYVGCGVRKDVQAAYRFLLPLTMVLPGRPRVPRPIEARAHSVLAAMELEDATRDPEEWNIDALFRAASFANNAAALGFVSPAVLNVARRTGDVGARSRATWRFSYPYNPEFAKLEFMWGAMDARLAEMEREDRKHDQKVAKHPASYRCAAPGCGITVTKKAALLRCAGGCPTDDKAHYCSKECQTEVRRSVRSQPPLI